MRVLSNYSHVSGHYKFALSQYEMAYRENKSDYLLVLCIAIVYINMACQTRQSSNRNAIIVQVIHHHLCKTLCVLHYQHVAKFAS